MRRTIPRSTRTSRRRSSARCPTNRSMRSASRSARCCSCALAARTPERFGRLVLIGVGANAFRTDDAHGALAGAFEEGGDPEDVQTRLFVQLARTAGNDPLAMVGMYSPAIRAVHACGRGEGDVPDARDHRRPRLRGSAGATRRSPPGRASRRAQRRRPFPLADRVRVHRRRARVRRGHAAAEYVARRVRRRAAAGARVRG